MAASARREGERGGAGDLGRAARLLDVRPPEEELRRLVQARMETLARLGGLAPAGAVGGASGLGGVSGAGAGGAPAQGGAHGAHPAPGAAGAPADPLALYPAALEVALARLREARA